MDSDWSEEYSIPFDLIQEQSAVCVDLLPGYLFIELKYALAIC